MEIQVTVEGVETAVAKLRRLDANLLQIIEPPINRGAFYLESGLKEYPPPPPDSRYRRGVDPRSERLGTRWTTEPRRGADMIGRVVGNTASYAPYVQSAVRQAWMHRGRWKTDEEILRESQPALLDDIAGALRRAAGE